MTARAPLFWLRIEQGRPTKVEPAAVREMALGEGVSPRLLGARLKASRGFRTERATYEPRFPGRNR